MNTCLCYCWMTHNLWQLQRQRSVGLGRVEGGGSPTPLVRRSSLDSQLSENSSPTQDNGIVGGTLCNFSL